MNIEELLKENDIKKVEEICRCSNLRPKVAIRVNNLKTNKEELAKLLEQRKIEFKEGSLEDFFILKNVKNIENLDLFRKGFFTIQDEGAGLVALIVEPQPNEIILDACSSPGGKTTYMAELMENKGKVISRETLMVKLWESDEYIDENTLTVNMTRLRRKLESIGLDDFITTKKGIGYIIE